MRSATRTASTVSATSWARTSAAPPSTATAVAASEPASRSPGLVRPVIAPMKDLRETAMQSGRPSAPSPPSPASTRASHSSHEIASSLKNPIPGSSTTQSSAIPAALALSSA